MWFYILDVDTLQRRKRRNNLMIMNRYRIYALLVACTLTIGSLHAQHRPEQTQDSVIVYTDKRPLVYEDAWDLSNLTDTTSTC